ncbi:hypothetical protein H6P81_017535 [Aristolochia fimbriata]|uniref:Aminotransferase-like plant mobile domain-containing protein n=1 Tax=Aristolochia fimbriata TaxID=158543 RepID=A0AAV7DZU5_ARIFI|nr:hypothetical protein H6P81_017535 [Aristolochia fimbriata]
MPPTLKLGGIAMPPQRLFLSSSSFLFIILFFPLLKPDARNDLNWQSYIDFLQHLPAICVKGRHIWLPKTPLICFEIVDMHAPDRVMLQFGLEQVIVRTHKSLPWRMSSILLAYPEKGEPGRIVQHTIVTTSLGGRRERILLLQVATPLDILLVSTCRSICRFISPPPTETTIVYHARVYTEETLSRAEIEHNTQEGRRARHRTTSETTLRVEDLAELPVILEPTVSELQPVQTPKPKPELPLEPQPDCHPPIHRIYTRRHKKAIGAPEPSSAL